MGGPETWTTDEIMNSRNEREAWAESLVTSLNADHTDDALSFDTDGEHILIRNENDATTTYVSMRVGSQKELEERINTLASEALKRD